MSQTVIPFGEWLPDQPKYGLQGSTDLTNVVPDANAYRPMPSLQVFTNALGGRALGGIQATDAANNAYNYAGDRSALYALVAGNSFSVVTRTATGYTTLGDDHWEFANWGNTIIAVNGHTDLPQQISLGAATFNDLSVGVKANHIAVMGDFVVLGNVSDSATQVYRIRWSAINNPTDFTPSAATLSDYQDLPSEGGPVQKLVSANLGGYIFQRRRISRMTFVGAPVIFDIQPVQETIGAFAPDAVTKYQNLVFFLSEDGFYSYDGNSEPNPIGRGKIDQFFRADLNPAYPQRINASIDPINKLVMWAYASNNSVAGNSDKLLVYSWAYQKWSLITGQNIEYLLATISTGFTLEQLDNVNSNLDLLPSSLDSLQWAAGSIILSAFDSNHKLGRYNGSAMPATITTGEFEMHTGQCTYLTEIRPLALGLSANLAVSIMNRNVLTESISTGAISVPINSTGFAPVRVTARYFSVRLSVSGNFDQLLGLGITGTPAGARYK